MNAIFEKLLRKFEDDAFQTPAAIFCSWIASMIIGDLLGYFDIDPKHYFKNSENEIAEHRTGEVKEAFSKYRFVEWGKYTIITGSKYSNGYEALPESEWCYTNLTLTPGTHPLRINFADKEKDQDPVYNEITQETASHFSVTPQELEMVVRKNCLFHEEQ